MKLIVPILGLLFVFSSGHAQVKSDLSRRMNDYLTSYCNDSQVYLTSYKSELVFERQVRLSICSGGDSADTPNMQILRFYRAKDSWEAIERINRRSDLRRFDQAMNEYFQIAFALTKEMVFSNQDQNFDGVLKLLNELRKEANKNNLAYRTQTRFADSTKP